jgi:hypothetical protein
MANQLRELKRLLRAICFVFTFLFFFFPILRRSCVEASEMLGKIAHWCLRWSNLGLPVCWVLWPWRHKIASTCAAQEVKPGRSRQMLNTMRCWQLHSWQDSCSKSEVRLNGYGDGNKRVQATILLTGTLRQCSRLPTLVLWHFRKLPACTWEFCSNGRELSLYTTSCGEVWLD